MKSIFARKKKVHFIGIGGIGMSAIAKILLEMGHRVSGSDAEPNSLTKKLESLGASIFNGHRRSNLPEDADLVIYSSAIDKQNPEVSAANRNRIPLVQRAYALSGLLNPRKGIAVTGTHGKTTTTSLISVMLARTGRNPTVAIGGEVDYFKSNARLGRGEWMVAEADESDGSFLYLEPFYTVVTNIEMEHVDHYKSMADAIDSYSRFINNTKKGGVFFYNNDDANIKEALKRYRGRRRSYGLSEDSLIYPIDIKMKGFRTSYRCVYGKKVLGTVRLNLPGIHNISNSLAAILVGLEMGINFESIVSSIADFKGAKRRFELKFDSDGLKLIDDYAHHPTEIRAAIEAAARFCPTRLVSVFQPHRFTRTKYLKKEFGKCFSGVDKLILTDVYAASERPIRGVTIKCVYEEVKKSGLKDVSIVKKEDIPRYMANESRPGDMVLVMGAGDIKKVADDLEEKFRMRAAFKNLRGKISFDAPLSGCTTFRIGGPADVLIEPKNEKELKSVMSICGANGWSIFVIGNGSNLLVGDNGWRGAVIRLKAPYFRSMEIKGSLVNVGAGYSLGRLIADTCGKGLGGLESLVGIPGTIGGAIVMNAGGAANPLFSTIGQYVRSVRVIDYSGKARTLYRDDLVFGYRSSKLSGYIILGARLKLSATDGGILTARCRDFLRIKKSKQVLDAPSAGCVFKNPKDSSFTAGQLIDMMGFKGRRIGGAQVSRKHANFIVNAGGAKCGDVMELMKTITLKAKEAYNIDLEPEVKIL